MVNQAAGSAVYCPISPGMWTKWHSSWRCNPSPTCMAQPPIYRRVDFYCPGFPLPAHGFPTLWAVWLITYRPLLRCPTDGDCPIMDGARLPQDFFLRTTRV